MKVSAALLLSIVILQPKPSALDAALAKLDAYLEAYEPKLSELIADEILIQEVNLPRNQLYMPPQAQSPGPSRVRRRIKSEVAFITLPNDTGWLGFRHVTAVDDRSVDQGKASLGSALQVRGYDAARALLNASAEHNLGLPRTTNLPNLPLEFLHQRNRKRLMARLDGRETVRGVNAVRIVLLERITPTVIRNPNTNADMPSVVRAWINDKNGQLLRAEVKTFASFEATAADNSLTVEFAPHQELGLLVPTRMREMFPVEPPRLGTGVADYSNFRRFQTSARIIPQPQDQ